jgi:hypothetical protein
MAQELSGLYTIIIAVYGAILSTILLIWKIVTHYLENTPRLKVELNHGVGETAFGITPHLIYINAANIGKKPVTLSSVGFDLGGHMNLIFRENTDLPKRLEDGESYLFYREIDVLKSELQKQAPEYQIPQYAWVTDQTGREHRSKNISKPIKNILGFS